MSDLILARAISALPMEVAPAPVANWVHDQAQQDKYGSAYLTDLAERCDAFIEEQTKILGWELALGSDVVDLDAGSDPEIKPRLADLKNLNRKRLELGTEIDYVDRLQDLPEHYVIGFKARQAARKISGGRK